MRITAINSLVLKHFIQTFAFVSQHDKRIENFYDKWYILHANEISYRITNDVRVNYY